LSFKTAEEAVAEISQYFEIESWTIKGVNMATLTFTIANIYDPKGNKPTGLIKTDTGKWLGYWPSDKHLFQEGIKYTAECEARDFKGVTYYTIKSPGRGGKITPVIVLEGGQAAPAPQPAPQQAPSASQGLSKDEIITRLAIAKSCIESNQTQADADSWLAWVKQEESDVPQSPQQPDVDDEIPF
tara:strand:+ start:376 stop:930 length:555 start_codon:yes stop_codon:yes gene_type:complete